MPMGPPRFELESPAPQAGRIPSYPTGPRSQYWDTGLIDVEDFKDGIVACQAELKDARIARG